MFADVLLSLPGVLCALVCKRRSLVKAEGRSLGVPRALSAHDVEAAGTRLPHVLAVSLKELCQDFLSI